MTADAVLFCPFCREPFEGLAHCPAHDLLLVPFRDLGPEQDPARDTEPVSRFQPGFGRGFVFAGAALTFLAFFFSLASLSGQVNITNSMLELARGRAPRLWLVPLAAAAQLVVLHRRRSLFSLRGARLTVLVFALVPSAAVASALFGIERAAQLLGERMSSTIDMQIGAGAWLVWLAALSSLYGGLRLGVRPLRRVRSRQVSDAGRSDSGR